MFVAWYACGIPMVLVCDWAKDGYRHVYMDLTDTRIVPTPFGLDAAIALGPACMVTVLMYLVLTCLRQSLSMDVSSMV